MTKSKNTPINNFLRRQSNETPEQAATRILDLHGNGPDNSTIVNHNGSSLLVKSTTTFGDIVKHLS